MEQNNSASPSNHLSEEQLSFLKNKLLVEKERILNKETDQSHFHLDKNELSDPVDEASANHLAETENRFRKPRKFLFEKDQ